MATTTTKDYSPGSEPVEHIEKEKIERVETADDHHTKDIHQINTLGVDPHNPDAEKGDDSDGKVDWTLKQIVAVCFLCGLYVGMSTHDISNQSGVSNTDYLHGPRFLCTLLVAPSTSSEQV